MGGEGAHAVLDDTLLDSVNGSNSELRDAPMVGKAFGLQVLQEWSPVALHIEAYTSSGRR